MKAAAKHPTAAMTADRRPGDRLGRTVPASRQVDRLFGTNVTQAFWEALYNGEIEQIVMQYWN